MVSSLQKGKDIKELTTIKQPLIDNHNISLSNSTIHSLYMHTWNIIIYLTLVHKNYKLYNILELVHKNYNKFKIFKNISDCYTQKSKSEREKQMSYININACM